MIKLKPTLFIGIGTSGLAIINAVRELLYEEFLVAGFPCVRFMHITSHTGGESYKLNSDLFDKEYEKIKISEISIRPDKYAQVRLKLNKNHTMYDPGLAEWLPPRLAEYGDVNLEEGMQNDRKLGRLAVWLNWNSLTEDLKTEVQKIQNGENVKKTNKMLHDYHTNRGIVIEGMSNYLNGGAEIYIAGSFLGGTGSGSFLDIAYYLRDTFPTTPLKAVFTVMDSALAGQPNNARIAANAYAAMVELDYYLQDGTTYNYHVPNSVLRKNITNPPFHHVSIITTKNMSKTSAAIVNESGTVDYESLHQLIGMTMFFDISTGTGGTITAVRENWNSTLKVQLPNPPRYKREISSFGAVAFWYPKSRIADIAAAKYIIRVLSSHWMGNESNSNPAHVHAAADQFSKQLRGAIIQKLSAFQLNGVNTTVQADWEQIYQGIRSRLTEEDINIEELKSILLTDPSSNPLAGRFKMNGFYYNYMNMNLIPLQQEVLQTIESMLGNHIQNTITSVFDKSAPRFTISDLQNFTSQIIKRIESLISTKPILPQGDIDFSVLEPNYEALKEEQSRVLTALVFARKSILVQHATRIADSVHYLLTEEQNLLFEHFLGTFLSNNLSMIKTTMNTVVGRIYEIVKDLERKSNDKIRSLMDMRNYTTLRIILNQPSLDLETNFLYGRINNNGVLHHLNTKTLPLLKTERSTSAEIFNDLLKYLQMEIMKDPTIVNFNIMSPENLNSATLLQYSNNTEPMFEPTINRQPMVYPNNQEPTLIAGGDSVSRNQAMNIINSAPGNKLKIEFQMNVDLNHLLYIYKEEAAIAISEFETFLHMKGQYERGGGTTGTHLDKDPSKFDIEKFLVEREMREEQWFRVAKDMFETDVFNEVIVNADNTKRYTILYKDGNNIECREYFFSGKEEDFYKKISDNRHLFDEFKKRFHSIFVNHDRALMAYKIETFKKNLVDNGLDPFTPEYQEIDAFYKKLLNSKYKIR